MKTGWKGTWNFVPHTSKLSVTTSPNTCLNLSAALSNKNLTTEACATAVWWVSNTSAFKQIQNFRRARNKVFESVYSICTEWKCSLTHLALHIAMEANIVCWVSTYSFCLPHKNIVCLFSLQLTFNVNGRAFPSGSRTAEIFIKNGLNENFFTSELVINDNKKKD